VKISYREIKASYSMEKREEEKCKIGYYVLRIPSFAGSWFLANIGLSANHVTIFSIFVSLVGFVLIVFKVDACKWLGAGLLLFRGYLEAVDGNIARYKGPTKLGAFLDDMGTALCNALLYPAVAMGVYVSRCSLSIGLPVELIIALGFWASLSRLTANALFQKFRILFSESVARDVIPALQTVSFKSLKGTMAIIMLNLTDVTSTVPIILIFATVLGWEDLFVVLYATLNTLIFLYTLYGLIRKSIREQKRLCS